jgi:plasmid stabilization system protein ParE
MVIWSHPAKRDLRNIHDHIASDTIEILTLIHGKQDFLSVYMEKQ